MKNARERVFFWIGVFVLPVFWSWFTLGSGFTSRQRFVAFSWLAAMLALAVSMRQALSEQWTLLGIGYPVVFGWVTITLLAWLFCRTGLLSVTFIEVLFMFVVLGPYLGYFWNELYYRAIGEPFSLGWFFAPLILIALHLVLDPLKRARWNIPFRLGNTDKRH